MAFDFASVKTRARQVVHDTLGVPAFYKQNAASDPLDLTVRWFEKRVRQGVISGEGAEIMEGVDQVLFNIPQLLERGAILARGATVVIPAYSLTLSLDYELPRDGPVEVIWAVVRI